MYLATNCVFASGEKAMKPEQNITPAKLADDSGYRVAAEAYRLSVTITNLSDLHLALFDLMQREARRVEADR